jgi:hypothetical protein
MCDFIENNNKCCKKKQYGDYCLSHKSNYLLNNKIIIYERYTNNIKDYLKKDLLNTLDYYNLNNYMKNKKKEYYFILLKEHFDFIKNNTDNLKHIIKIQYNIKKYNKNKDIKLRGPGYLNRKECMNDEDFFTYISKSEIENDYFISYKDDCNSLWCFDTRSLKKLIDMKMTNPYTRKEIPEYVKNNVELIIIKIKLNNKSFSHDEDIKKERNNSIKQKTVDLFSKIEISGFPCDINWLLSLNIIRLKKLYKGLEDIWNFRAQLSLEAKIEIAPPNGILFNIPINQVLNMNSQKNLQEVLLNELTKIDNRNNNLGYIYFLIGLCEVSSECFNTYNWLLS